MDNGVKTNKTKQNKTKQNKTKQNKHKHKHKHKSKHKANTNINANTKQDISIASMLQAPLPPVYDCWWTNEDDLINFGEFLTASDQASCWIGGGSASGEAGLGATIGDGGITGLHARIFTEITRTIFATQFTNRATRWSAWPSSTS